MLKKKGVLFYGCIIMVCLSLFVGCSHSGESTGNENNQAGQKDQTEQVSRTTPLPDESDEKVNMRFLWWGNEARHKATIETIEKYQKKNPNITIEAEYGSFDGHYQKLVTQLASETAPDLMQIDNPWIYDFAKRGEMFVDLYTLTDIIDISGFDKKTLEQTAEVDGKLQGLPFGVNALTFLINKEFMEEQGIPLDTRWTWESILEEGKRIHEKDDNLYLMNCDFRTLRSLIVPQYLYQKTGKMYAQDDYTIGVKKEDFVDMFTYVKNLYDYGVIQPIEDAILYELKTEQNPKWINGEFGGIITWAAQVKDWKENVSYDLTVSQYPVPIVGNNKSTVLRPAMFFAINKLSGNIEEAAKFMDFWFNNEEAIETLGDVRSAPPTVKGQELLTEKNLIDKDIIKAVSFASEDPSEPMSAMVTDTRVEQVLADTIQRMAYNELTPEQAADEFMDLLQAKLDELKELE